MGIRDNQMVMALETSQNRVVELIKELESMRESHAIILETKDSVFRQLIKQNSQISAEVRGLVSVLDNHPDTVYLAL